MLLGLCTSQICKDFMIISGKYFITDLTFSLNKNLMGVPWKSYASRSLFSRYLSKRSASVLSEFILNENSGGLEPI